MPGSMSNTPTEPCTTTALLCKNSLSWIHTPSATCCNIEFLSLVVCNRLSRLYPLALEWRWSTAYHTTPLSDRLSLRSLATLRRSRHITTICKSGNYASQHKRYILTRNERIDTHGYRDRADTADTPFARYDRPGWPAAHRLLPDG